MGALGGARATLTRNDALARAVRVTGVPVFRTWQSLQRGGTLAALPHRAQSSVRVNARDFWADVPHRNRDHRAYGAVRRVHSFFPYNVTDARILYPVCTPVYGTLYGFRRLYGFISPVGALCLPDPVS